jgi:hypothetical protein
MDARTYTAETAVDERLAEECEAETTRVFRKVPPQAQRRLDLLAQAAGNTARAASKAGR